MARQLHALMSDPGDTLLPVPGTNETRRFELQLAGAVQMQL